MNVKKFFAATAREGLHKVKAALGDDAIILSNRNVADGVEIMAVASHDMAAIVSTPAPAQMSSAPRRIPSAPAYDSEPVQRAAPASVRGFDTDDDYQVSFSSASRNTATAERAAQQRPAMPRREPQRPTAQRTDALMAGAAHVARPSGDFSRSHAASPAAPVAARPAENVVPNEVMEELRALRQMVEQQLAGFAWRDMTHTEPNRGLLLGQMLDAGFSPAYARGLVEALPAGLTAAAATGWAQDRTAKDIHVSTASDDLIDQGGVYALVGPTGVGKTTTAAKLAARCVLRHGASRVALITSDAYRIGAHEQLRIYGRILGVPVYSVKDAMELKTTLRELGGKHMVIIDTMGMSQRDKNVISQSQMLGDAAVKRLLLLSATSRGDTLDDVVRAYGQGGIAGCIISKIDEAVGLGAAIDVVLRHKLHVRYVSNGQRVPEDMHLPNTMYLAHRAFKGAPEDSPHRHRNAEPALMMGARAAAGAVRA